jgi:hypothetical protein
MDDPAIYRKYAEECRRLAKSMSAQDTKILTEIAEAWLECARQAERRASSTGTHEEERGCPP